MKNPNPLHITLGALIAPFLISLLAPASASTASWLTQEDLLNRSQRPTVQDALSLAPFYEDPAAGVPVNPSGRNQTGWAIDKWIDVAFEEAPKLIASLEKAFPGGKFAFMGRDADLLADLVETFYLSIGQKDRVVRIGVSKASFLKPDGATPVEDELLIKLLEQSGFDLNEVLEKGRPFVFVDTVSGGVGRQGRHFLSLIYKEFKKRTRKDPPTSMLARLNMVGLIVSTFGGEEFPIQSIENSIMLQEAALAISRHDFTEFWKRPYILTFKPKNPYAFEFGYEHHAFAWNQSYGPIKESGESTKGQIRAEIGQPFPTLDRAAHLAFQNRVVERARSKEFAEQVFLEAKEVGAQFSTKWTPMVIESDQSSQTRLKEILKRNQKTLDEAAMKKAAQSHKGLYDLLSPSKSSNSKSKPPVLSKDTALTFINVSLAQDASPENSISLLNTLADLNKKGHLRDNDLPACLEPILPNIRPTLQVLKFLAETTPRSLEKPTPAFKRFARYTKILRLR